MDSTFEELPKKKFDVTTFREQKTSILGEILNLIVGNNNISNISLESVGIQEQV